MKSKPLSLGTLALLLTLSPRLSTALAQGTAFTYQGRLDDGGSPATGLYDFRCAIYDAAGNGNAVGGVLTNTATPITNGLFTVTLDFGGGVFNGGARWLELGVRTNGSGAFITLTPRQGLTMTPYAAYAIAAGASDRAGVANFAYGAPAAALVGTLTLNQLPAAVVTNYSTGVTLDGTFTGSGASLTNVNADQLDGQHGAFYQNAANLNSGTLADARLSANVPLLNANQSFTGTNLFSQRVGIGTSNPGQLLQVGDTNTPGAQGMIRLGSRSPSGGALRSWDIGVPQTGTDTSGIGYSFVIDDMQLGTSPEFIIRYGTGFVGIGKTNPATTLDVNGTVTATNFAGIGAGITGVNADQLDGQHGAFYQNAANLTGTVPLGRLPSAVLTNNANGVQLSGTFGGNGGGLTNLNGAQITGSISANNIAAGMISGAMLAGGAVGSSQLADSAVTATKVATVSNWFALTITKPAPVVGDQFGASVAVVGTDRLLIGAWGDNTSATDAGAAYLLSTNGALLTTFTNPTPAAGDLFGVSVAAVGTDMVLIGAPYDDTGATDAGAAYLFRTNGTLLTAFTNPAPATGEYFGYSVAAVGTSRVLIGAFKDNTGATDAGAAYLFNTNGTLLVTFTNPTPELDDEFGWSVAALGTDRVLIGAINDSTGGDRSGSVYLFNTNGTLLTTLTNPAPSLGAYFGWSLAVVGTDRVLVGARLDSTRVDNAGAAYLLNTNGVLLTTFAKPVPAVDDDFGYSVAAVGTDRVLIGAYSDSTAASRAGAAYLFSTNGALLTTFVSPTPVASGAFGSSVAAVGANRFLIGTPNDNPGATGAGAVYLFSVETYTPGLVADGVNARSITTASLQDGAVTAAKIGGVLAASQIPDLDASKVTSGTLADARLSANVALLNANQAFTGANRFAGVVTLTNTGNLLSGTGTFSGNGAGLTGLNASQLTTGTVPLAQLPGAVVTNNETGITLAGTFSGNGGGLTNVPGTLVYQTVSGTSQTAAPNQSYLLTNNGQVTITLPPAPNLGDFVRVSDVGVGGWKIAQNSGQAILVGNLPGSTNAIGAMWTARASNQGWGSVASSADGAKLVAAVSGGLAGYIYTSTDAGLSWTPHTGNGSLYWISVASSADGTKLVGVVQNGRIYTSSDSGATWIPRGISTNWISVASSADGTKLIAAVFTGQLFTSTDSGTNWTARASGQGWGCVASSADGTKLVAGVQPGQIWTSIDSGINWAAHGGSQSWSSLASSADGTKLVAAVYGGQLWTSTDSGTNWTARESIRNWRSVASSADGTKLAAVVGNGQIYTSCDSGVTWTARAGNLGNQPWYSVASSADGTRLVAVIQFGQIYTSVPSTSLGVAGYLTGAQYGAIELQYTGNGQFIPLSHEGTITAY